MVQTEVDVHEEHWFAFKLEDATNNVEIVPLSEGDFKLTDDEGRTTVIERKTWGDAMSSWKQKRLQDQLSRIVLNATTPMLLVEGRPELVYNQSNNDIAGLQAFLNRVSIEVCPVVYTANKEDTVRQIAQTRRRMKEGSFYTFIRPVTVVSSSRDKHHAMLERIPKVGLTTAKKIHAHFNDMTDFVTNWTDRPCMKTNSKTHQAIAEFLLQPWGEPKEEREILGSRTEDSPTPMSLGKKQTNLLDEGQC